MKTKKVFVMLLTAVFLFVVLFATFFMFNVRQVRVKYTVNQNKSIESVENCLNKYLGKNLLFLDLEDVEREFSNLPYFEVSEIKKEYPNVITLSVKERKEVYHLVDENASYILNEQGIILNHLEQTQVNDKNIKVELKNSEITSAEVGAFLKTAHQEYFDLMLDMVSAVEYADSIESIEIDCSKELEKINFYTKTGVTIVINHPLRNGKQMAIEGFKGYNDAEDYYKSFDTIIVTCLDSGDVNVFWTNKDKGE